jgi:hypothetical protein
MIIGINQMRRTQLASESVQRLTHEQRQEVEIEKKNFGILAPWQDIHGTARADPSSCIARRLSR